MALGMSPHLATAWLNALVNGTSFVILTPYIKLHTGDPGSAGTANAATETTRKLVSFGAPSAPSGGFVTVQNDQPISWAPIAGTQDATFASLWDAVTGGNHLANGAITGSGYTAGDTYTVSTGGLTLTLAVLT